MHGASVGSHSSVCVKRGHEGRYLARFDELLAAEQCADQGSLDTRNNTGSPHIPVPVLTASQTIAMNTGACQGRDRAAIHAV